VIDSALYEAAAIDGASEFRVIRAIKLPALRGPLVVAGIFSIVGSFQLFNEPQVLDSLAPNSVTTYFTPNIYAYQLSFAGQQVNYSATIALLMGVSTMIVAYLFQLRTMRGSL
jgi:multiple sugar transport system permease protein